MDEQATADTKKDYAKYGAKILERIRASEKREKTWLDDAEAAEKAYAADTMSEAKGPVYDFNILHSNVETIVPAIYNSTPQPDIRPRRVENTGPQPKPPQQPQEAQGQPQDPRQAMALQQQMMQFQQAMQEFQAKKQRDDDARNFASLIERAISVQIDDNKLDTEIEANAQDGFTAGRGLVRLRFEGVYGKSEKITFEAVSWKDYRCGPAKRWNDLPWEAYKVVIARETYDRIAKDNAELIEGQRKADDAPKTLGENQDDDIDLWEVWDAIEKKVCLVRADDGLVISEQDDPLELPGFFPRPTPLQPITTTGKLTPVCPFAIYKKLADELDKITKRINKIMSGLKVRGVVVGDASTLAKLADLDDNEVAVETNLEGLMQTGGLEKAVLWWPVEQAIRVLAELYKQREEVKASIYEITGISDIVRGASSPQETLGAQQIKTQWGSLRIQRMQRQVERQVRDIFVIMGHILTTKFSPQTLTRMTGIEITPGMQELMQNPIDADYRINVESDSTVRADLTQKKKEMGEFLQGSAAFFQVAGQLIAQEPAAAEPLAEIYGSISRMYNLGKETEDALERFRALAKESAAKPRPNPEQQKMQMEAKAKEAEMQMRQADMQQKQAETQAKMAQDAQKAAAEIEIKKAELAIKGKELEIKDRELLLKTIESQVTRELEAERIEAERERSDKEMGLRVVEGDRKERMDREKNSERAEG